MFLLLSATVLRPRDIPGFSYLFNCLYQSPIWIRALETAFVSVIVLASAIYLGFLAWRKFKESVNRV